MLVKDDVRVFLKGFLGLPFEECLFEEVGAITARIEKKRLKLYKDIDQYAKAIHDVKLKQLHKHQTNTNVRHCS